MKVHKKHPHSIAPSLCVTPRWFLQLGDGCASALHTIRLHGSSTTPLRHNTLRNLDTCSFRRSDPFFFFFFRVIKTTPSHPNYAHVTVSAPSCAVTGGEKERKSRAIASRQHQEIKDCRDPLESLKIITIKIKVGMNQTVIHPPFLPESCCAGELT